MSVKENVICYAPGDRCHGCDHYHGKASDCCYKTRTDRAVESAALVSASALAEQGYDAVKCIEMLPEIMKEAPHWHTAIGHLDADALGEVPDTPDWQGHFIRDEMLYRLGQILKKAGGAE